MLNSKQLKAAEKLTPELFLKQVLCGPYEIVDRNNIFRVSDKLVLQEISKSVDVDCCKNIDDFKAKLQHGKPNLLVDVNLLNTVLLKEIIAASSQTKNIILGDL